MAESDDARPNQAANRPAYPFMWAMGNAIFLLLGLGAILDPEPQSFGPKVTGSLALLAAGAMQGRGLGPQYSQNARLFTAVFLAFDALVIAGIWLIR